MDHNPLKRRNNKMNLDVNEFHKLRNSISDLLNLTDDQFIELDNVLPKILSKLNIKIMWG